MRKPLRIKLVRTTVFDPDDYGPQFEKCLDRLVGGKSEWKQSRNAHRQAMIPGTRIVVQRHEDGPEFWFNLANLALASGSFVVSTVALWYQIPKREKKENGERHVRISTPQCDVRITARGTKGPSERQLKQILKALGAKR
jgi:hypothetical protein